MFENPKDKADAIADELINEMAKDEIEALDLFMALFNPSVSPEQYLQMIQDFYNSRQNQDERVRERRRKMAREYYESMMLTRFSEEFTDSVMAYLDKAESISTSPDDGVYKIFSDMIDGCLEKNWTEQQIIAFMAENPLE